MLVICMTEIFGKERRTKTDRVLGLALGPMVLERPRYSSL